MTHPAQVFYEEPHLSDRERASQTKMLMRLFALWNLSSVQQSLFLGLSANTRTQLAKYKSGTSFLPLARDTQDRIRYLFQIHQQLRNLFPRNNELVYQWIHLRNRAFDQFSPLEIICRDGIVGLAAIKRYLDKVLAI